MAKLKKLFCLKTDMQDNAYEKYVATRNSRKREKAIVDALNVPRSPNTANGNMTRSKWISVKSDCTGADDRGTPLLLRGEGQWMCAEQAQQVDAWEWWGAGVVGPWRAAPVPVARATSAAGASGGAVQPRAQLTHVARPALRYQARQRGAR